ncbi:hypothetical protein PGT21_022248 [Puccinia graminis f. sp. tritici]|uniref:Uncharacterized protein n=1 Tax=Puccinia graminis f. sp. tritici TaxID=56615 RepID=A0A5B0ML77_PUCGR|nr:hypothetical protein PGT21_022248 [Puccinia graminis f. sp. tritici]
MQRASLSALLHVDLPVTLESNDGGLAYEPGLQAGHSTLRNHCEDGLRKKMRKCEIA